MKSMGKALNKVPDALHMSEDVDERACCALLTRDCCCCGCLTLLTLCGLAADAKPYGKVPTRADSGGGDRTRYYAGLPSEPTLYGMRPNEARRDGSGGRENVMRDVQASVDRLNPNSTPVQVRASQVIQQVASGNV